MRHSVSSYEEDNLGAAKPEGDDTGLPENPIYSNFPRHLWRTHARHGLVQSPNRSRENTDGHRPTPDGPSPVYSALSPNHGTSGGGKS